MNVDCKNAESFYTLNENFGQVTQGSKDQQQPQKREQKETPPLDELSPRQQQQKQPEQKQQQERQQAKPQQLAVEQRSLENETGEAVEPEKQLNQLNLQPQPQQQPQQQQQPKEGRQLTTEFINETSTDEVTTDSTTLSS